MARWYRKVVCSQDTAEAMSFTVPRTSSAFRCSATDPGRQLSTSWPSTSTWDQGECGECSWAVRAGETDKVRWSPWGVQPTHTVDTAASVTAHYELQLQANQPNSVLPHSMACRPQQALLQTQTLPLKQAAQDMISSQGPHLVLAHSGLLRHDDRHPLRVKLGPPRAPHHLQALAARILAVPRTVPWGQLLLAYIPVQPRLGGGGRMRRDPSSKWCMRC